MTTAYQRSLLSKFGTSAGTSFIGKTVYLQLELDACKKTNAPRDITNMKFVLDPYVRNHRPRDFIRAMAEMLIENFYGDVDLDMVMDSLEKPARISERVQRMFDARNFIGVDLDMDEFKAAAPRVIEIMYRDLNLEEFLKFCENPYKFRPEVTAEQVVDARVPNNERFNRHFIIKIYNFPTTMRKYDLRQMVRKYKNIACTKLALDYETKACKGYGFVSFFTEDQATLAAAEINGHCYSNHVLTAEKCKWRGTT